MGVLVLAFISSTIPVISAARAWWMADLQWVFIEDKAANTDQNIRYSLIIIEDNALERDLTVVTDSYHQLRARIIAGKNAKGIKVGAVNTRNGMIGLAAYPGYFVREWIAIPVEIIK